jgi:acyl-CoA thioester hydrolase
MQVRIYYEDTDAAGVVYHANYLKFFERARTEYFRERGLVVSELAAAGHVFPVVRMEVDFIAPARHDDLLSIVTSPVQSCGSSFSLRQQVYRACDDRLLVNALVKLACVGHDLKARRIPKEVRQSVNVQADGVKSVVNRLPERKTKPE